MSCSELSEVAKLGYSIQVEDGIIWDVQAGQQRPWRDSIQTAGENKVI